MAQIKRPTQFSLTMSSTFCTVVPFALPVKSNRTPKAVTLRPLYQRQGVSGDGFKVFMNGQAYFRVLNLANREPIGTLTLSPFLSGIVILTFDVRYRPFQ